MMPKGTLSRQAVPKTKRLYWRQPRNRPFEIGSSRCLKTEVKRQEVGPRCVGLGPSYKSLSKGMPNDPSDFIWILRRKLSLEIVAKFPNTFPNSCN
jgi:hypothetical protein